MRRMRLACHGIILLGLLAAAVPLWAASAVGTITDAFGQPLQGVLISATGATATTYTNWSGKYSLALSAGAHTLTPRRPGYVFTPASKTINIASKNVSTIFRAKKATGDGVVRRWAVLVGISDYVGSYNDLNYCDDDARDLKATLTASGWPAANITMLIDAQGTKTNIRNAIANMASQADADDLCLFFQSGHGTQTTDKAPLDESDRLDEVLCTYNISTEEISDDELGVWLTALKTRRYVVLIDTCYSGGLIKSSRPAGSFSFAEDVVFAHNAGQMNTSDLDDNGAGVVVTACRDNELSEESGKLQNGVFIYYALRGINNGKADTNGDGWVSAEEVYSYSRPFVTSFNPTQTVELYDGYPGELNFARLTDIISSSTPAASAKNVGPATPVAVTFRKVVRQASAEKKFRLLDCTGQPVPGTFSWPTPNKTLSFTPDAALRQGVRYTVKLVAGLVLNDGAIWPRAEAFTFITQNPAPGAALAVSGAAVPTASGQTQITLNLSSAASISARICNLAGREISVLKAQNLAQGVSTLLWNGKSTQGTAAPPGQYLVQVEARGSGGHTARCLLSLRK